MLPVACPVVRRGAALLACHPAHAGAQGGKGGIAPAAVPRKGPVGDDSRPGARPDIVRINLAEARAGWIHVCADDGGQRVARLRTGAADDPPPFAPRTRRARATIRGRG